MIRGAKALAVTAALMFVGGSIAASAATGASGAGNGAGQAGGGSCQTTTRYKTRTPSPVVTILRGSNGSCTCIITRGPGALQARAVVGLVQSLTGSSDCNGAAPEVSTPTNPGGGPSSGALVAGGVGAAAAAGVAAAGGKDSP